MIDDGEGPPDREPERLPAEAQSDLAKSQDSQPTAVAQGPGLPSRTPGQPGGDPGTQWGYPSLCLWLWTWVFLAHPLKSHELFPWSGSFSRAIQSGSPEDVCPLHCGKSTQSDQGCGWVSEAAPSPLLEGASPDLVGLGRRLCGWLSTATSCVSKPPSQAKK